jgi:ADP-ribosylglycohydrolase
MKLTKANFRGCLLGGAVGDALAYDTNEGGKNLISDNTQLASFTVDGLIWADDRAVNRGVYAYLPCLFYSYQKWYYTQTGSLADKNYEFILGGEILKYEELFARRGQGNTSMNALKGSINNSFGTIKNRINNNKGCGSVMRSAPIGLYFCMDERIAFHIGCEGAALTHGHTDALLASGFLAYLISGIIQGKEIKDVAMESLAYIGDIGRESECYNKIKQALIMCGDSPAEVMEEIGEGRTADEAVALALYLAIRYGDDFEGAITTASKYKGNRSTISAVCGTIMGAYLGDYEIPFKWLKKLELVDLITYGADKILDRVQNGIQSQTEIKLPQVELV